MEELARRTMAATPWLLLLCLAAAAGGVLQARAQPDSKGYITIDCGLQGKTDRVDNDTKLAYAPDNGEFTDDAGTCHNISAQYMSPSMHESWYNVRSFAAGARNCYTLCSLVPGLKYLVRASFMYGNYDGLNRPPVFDPHLGVNYRYTVSIARPDEAKFVEVIAVVPDNFVQATKAQGLVLLSRLNYGSAGGIVRYPDDPDDRLWFPSVNSLLWAEMSTTRKVQNVDNDSFEAPSAVLQTAIRPRNGSQNTALLGVPAPNQ
ncbi:hypothetical protein ACQ4PT_022600 [Festuca glaucescens]